MSKMVQEIETIQFDPNDRLFFFKPPGGQITGSAETYVELKTIENARKKRDLTATLHAIDGDISLVRAKKTVMDKKKLFIILMEEPSCKKAVVQHYMGKFCDSAFCDANPNLVKRLNDSEDPFFVTLHHVAQISSSYAGIREQADPLAELDSHTLQDTSEDQETKETTLVVSVPPTDAFQNSVKKAPETSSGLSPSAIKGALDKAGTDLKQKVLEPIIAWQTPEKLWSLVETTRDRDEVFGILVTKCREQTGLTWLDKKEEYKNIHGFIFPTGEVFVKRARAYDFGVQVENDGRRRTRTRVIEHDDPPGAATMRHTTQAPEDPEQAKLRALLLEQRRREKGADEPGVQQPVKTLETQPPEDSKRNKVVRTIRRYTGLGFGSSS